MELGSRKCGRGLKFSEDNARRADRARLDTLNAEAQVARTARDFAREMFEIEFDAPRFLSRLRESRFFDVDEAHQLFINQREQLVGKAKKICLRC